MSFAILGLGTALPSTRVTQADAVRIAEKLCCRTPEQAGWLPGLYRQTTIASRYFSFGQDVVQDVLEETRQSGSVFLPRDSSDHQGPSTSQRMQHYIREAGPMAVRAAQKAL